MLEGIGLTSTAEALYEAMLAEPSLGVAGLCARLSLPERTVRDSLDELVRFGLVRDSLEIPDGCGR